MPSFQWFITPLLGVVGSRVEWKRKDDKNARKNFCEWICKNLRCVCILSPDSTTNWHTMREQKLYCWCFGRQVFEGSSAVGWGWRLRGHKIHKNAREDAMVPIRANTSGSADSRYVRNSLRKRILPQTHCDIILFPFLYLFLFYLLLTHHFPTVGTRSFA